MKQIGIKERRETKRYLNSLLLEEIKELIEDSPYKMTYKEMSTALECEGGLLVRLITNELKQLNKNKPRKIKVDISK